MSQRKTSQLAKCHANDERNLPVKKSSSKETKKKPENYFSGIYKSWHRATLPQGDPCSTIAADGLNC
jgi:hypothetical protein